MVNCVLGHDALCLVVVFAACVKIPGELRKVTARDFNPYPVTAAKKLEVDRGLTGSL